MPKAPKTFKHVTFDWMTDPDTRTAVEDTLRQLGFDVDGGITDLATRTSVIYIRPKARNRRKRPVGIAVE